MSLYEIQRCKTLEIFIMHTMHSMHKKKSCQKQCLFFLSLLTLFKPLRVDFINSAGQKHKILECSLLLIYVP